MVSETEFFSASANPSRGTVPSCWYSNPSHTTVTLVTVLSTTHGTVHLPPALFTQYCSSTWYCLHSTIHLPPVLCPVRSPCRTTLRQLPFVLSSSPSSRRPRTLRHRPPLPVAASRPPSSSLGRRSPRLPPWSRQL
jgi:hypothetical protein